MHEDLHCESRSLLEHAQNNDTVDEVPRSKQRGPTKMTVWTNSGHMMMATDRAIPHDGQLDVPVVDSVYAPYAKLRGGSYYELIKGRSCTAERIITCLRSESPTRLSCPIRG